jgi:transposase-like protein
MTFQFVFDITKDIFRPSQLGEKGMKKRLFQLLETHRDDPVKIATLNHINEYRFELTGFNTAWNEHKLSTPRSTNIIESFNKQLNGRLKTIQGFQHPQTASLWLSAWVLRRRLTPFTDCRGKFKKLNGKTPIDRTKKGGIILPNWFEL